MYICLCHAVTDRQIREAVNEGAYKMRDLRRKLGLCSSCGACGKSAYELLRASLDDTQGASRAPA